MAVLISDGETTLSTANGFYEVEAYNLGCFSTTFLALTTTRYINVTFAHAGDCQGIVLMFKTTDMTSREVVVNLQEDVGGTWTTRATKTLTTADIAGSDDIRQGTTYKYVGQYTIPFKFETPYTVTTAASTWRFEIAHGGGTGTWDMYTSDASNPFYATWCDNQKTFTDGDVLVCKDKVIIDKTATIGSVLGTGTTFYGTSIVLCTNYTDPSPDGVAMLEWENPPTSSYTFTVRNDIVVGAFSGIRIGTSDNPIPIAQKAIFHFGTKLNGLYQPRIVQPTGSASSSFGGMSSFFFYGEKPTYAGTSLSEDAASGQAVLTVADNVDWVNGDKVVVGKQDTQGQGDVNTYTISSVVGNEITLTSNLSTYTRKGPTDGDEQGGTVMLLDCHGVMFSSDTSANSQHQLSGLLNMVFDGVDIVNHRMSVSNVYTYFYPATVKDDYRSQFLVRDCSVYATNNTSSFFTGGQAPIDGWLIERCYFFRTNVSGSFAYSAHNDSGYVSGEVAIKDCFILSKYSYQIVDDDSLKVTISGTRFENSRTSNNFHTICGRYGTFKDNYYWGCGMTTGTGGGAVRVVACSNPIEFGNNVYENNLCALYFDNYPTINIKDRESKFYSNTTDIMVNSGAMPDYTFISNVGDLTIDTTSIEDMVLGTGIKFVNYNQTTNDDRGLFTYGRTQRTKAGLDDENVHTSGGSAVRFSPTSPFEPFEYIVNLPTGDISDKDWCVGVWCKINSSNYWSSTHQMPKLTIEYEDGKTVYDEASQMTDWQYLSVNFRPTTNYGKLKITLSVMSVATGSDAYVYWDDWGGGSLVNSNMDIWIYGLPSDPAWSFLINAADFWGSLKSMDYGEGTMGEWVKKLLSKVTFWGTK